MGQVACSPSPPSSPEDAGNIKADKNMNKALAKYKGTELPIRKLLFLGTAGSGKSTIFKQLTSLYGQGFSNNELRTYFPLICENIYISMATLIKESRKRPDCRYDDSLEPLAVKILELKDRHSLSTEFIEIIEKLWADEGIKQTFAERAHFQCEDTAAYFFDKVTEFAPSLETGKPYVPTTQDVFNVRIPSKGISEGEITINSKTTRMIDVGGQRNQRRKWIHCFHGVTALLYIFAVNEYDMLLAEDNFTNRYDEALVVFEDVVNLTYFKHSQVILFLNKMDLLEEKLPKSSFKKHMKRFKGDEQNSEDIVLFLKKVFRKLIHSKKREIFIHPTIANDAENVKFTFRAIRSILVDSNVQEMT